MPKNAPLRSSEMHVSTAPSFVCANFPHVPNFRIFAAWNAISADSWNQRFKVPRKDGWNFLNFWVSKMRFCRVVKSTIKGYQASCEEIFRKYQTSCEQIFHVLVVWNFDFCRFVKPTCQGTRKKCKNFLPFWDLKMRFYLVVKSTFEGYQASCERILRMYQASGEQIFWILAVWKFDCCRFVKPTFQGTSQRGDILHFWGLKMRFCPVVKCTFER